MQDFSPTHMLTSLNGKKMPAINVIAEALAFLKTELLKYIKSKTGIELSTNEIRWVLTVPAIWTMGARHVMRKAAYKVYTLVYVIEWPKTSIFRSRVKKLMGLPLCSNYLPTLLVLYIVVILLIQ